MNKCWWQGSFRIYDSTWPGKGLLSNNNSARTRDKHPLYGSFHFIHIISKIKDGHNNIKIVAIFPFLCLCATLCSIVLKGQSVGPQKFPFA